MDKKMNPGSRRGNSENKNDFSSFLRIFGIFTHLMAFSYPIQEDGGCFEIVKTNTRPHKAKVKAVGMESLYPDLMRILLQHLDVRSMMMLRCVSTTLRERVDEWEMMFKNWKFTTAFSTAKLYKFADEVRSVKSLSIGDATDAGVRYLVKTHPEIEIIQLGDRHLYTLNHPPQIYEDPNRGLQSLLSLPNLKSIEINSLEIIAGKSLKIQSSQLHTLGLYNLDISEAVLVSLVETCKNTLRNLYIPGNENVTDSTVFRILELCGDNLKSLNVSCTKVSCEDLYETLPCLEDLNCSWNEGLTDEGLLNIFQLCGRTLKTLNVSNTNITGELLCDFDGSLPNLENVTISACKYFTDEGLLMFLWLCGNTLKSLDISITYLRGEFLTEYYGILPCLENLSLKFCLFLSDEGLVKFLFKCRKTLNSLDLSKTNITGELIKDLKGALPSLETLNLSQCENLSEHGLSQLIIKSKHTLRSLDISRTNITGEAQYGTLHALQSLNLEGSRLTDTGLLQTIRQCGGTIQSLNISRTNITGGPLWDYDQSLLSIQNLNCTRTLLTDTGLLQLIWLCGSQLETLDISRTYLSDAVTKQILQDYDNVKLSHKDRPQLYTMPLNEANPPLFKIRKQFLGCLKGT